MTTHATIEQLLAHTEWVRRIAGALVSDPNRAEDVIQETWRLVLERPPQEIRNPRGWLARVTENAARSLGRSDASRRRREGVVAADTTGKVAPSTQWTAERIELQRELGACVLLLEEPCRETIVLRYFDGLGVREIAERHGVSEATVRSRLSRGLERLRHRLDTRFGERSAWIAAVAPLARDAVLPIAGTSHGVMPWVLVAAVVLVSFAVIVVDADPPADLSIRPLAQAEPLAETPSTDLGERLRRSEIAAVDAVPPPLADARPVDEVTLHGRVVDGLGRGVEGIEVRPDKRVKVSWGGDDGRWLRGQGRGVRIAPDVEEMLRRHEEFRDDYFRGYPEPEVWKAALLGEAPPGPVAVTDTAGRFMIDVSRQDGTRMEATSPAYHELGSGTLSTPDGEDCVIVVAPAVPLQVVVRDESGRPIEGARIDDSGKLYSLPRFPWTLSDRLLRSRSEARTDAEGRATWSAAAAPGGVVTVSHPEFLSATHPLDGLVEGSTITVTLARTVVPARPTIAGIALLPGGVPAASAVISLGQENTSCGADGRFEFALSYVDARASLVATFPGMQAIVLDEYGAEVKQDPRDRLDLMLVFDDPALAIEGVAVDWTGQPLVGYEIDLSDPTPRDNSTIAAEHVSISPKRSAYPTDAQGRFRVEGLRDRTYRLRLSHPTESLLFVAEPVRAGTTGYRLVVPADVVVSEVRGRVVDQRGNPLSDVAVKVAFTRNGLSAREYVPRGMVTTGSDGRIALVDVPRRDVYFLIVGAGIKLDAVPVESLDLGAELRLVAEVAGRFQVVVPPGHPADRLCVLDEHGDAVTMDEIRHNCITSVRAVSRRDGAFSVCEVSDAGATVVLYDGDVELSRHPLLLERGGIVEIRP